jgi:integrase
MKCPGCKYRQKDLCEKCEDKKRAGIGDFRFHDLRHSFASYLTMGGVNLRTVQTLLGHKDLRMTMRYSHLSPEHLREAVSTLDKGLNKSVHNQEVQIGNSRTSQL